MNRRRSNQYRRVSPTGLPGRVTHEPVAEAVKTGDLDDPDLMWAFDPVYDRWRQQGFTRTEFVAWGHWGAGFTPETAAQWRNSGYGPDEARALWNAGFHSPTDL